MIAKLTPEQATKYAATIARMMLHGQAADAAQVVILVGHNEYERGKAEASAMITAVGDALMAARR